MTKRQSNGSLQKPTNSHKPTSPPQWHHAHMLANIGSTLGSAFHIFQWFCLWTCSALESERWLLVRHSCEYDEIWEPLSSQYQETAGMHAALALSEIDRGHNCATLQRSVKQNCNVRRSKFAEPQPFSLSHTSGPKQCHLTVQFCSLTVE